MEQISNRIVVKVGTSSLTNESGQEDLRSMEHIARVLADLRHMGQEVILVSSGAIAIGSNRLGLTERPRELRMKQAAAAVGQSSMMYLYDRFFGGYGQSIAQILLNADDIRQEEKRENLVRTFGALLEMGVVPIVNENDSVSYTEIESEDRLFDKDPRLFPDARLIRQVDHIDDALLAAAGGAGSRRGTGGMKTKLQAARLAAAQGIDTVILNGRRPDLLYDVVAGKPAGTRFVGKIGSLI